MEEAELVKERLQAITVSLAYSYNSWRRLLIQTEALLAAPAAEPRKWKNRTVTFHGRRVSATLLTLVTLCNSWFSEPEYRANVLDFHKNCAYVLNSSQKLLRQFG